MNTKVLFNTWNAAFFVIGGGEVQLLNSKKFLEKNNVSVDLYNMWEPQKNFDIFHQFSSVPGVEYVVDAYKSAGKKIALSTIFWNEHLTSEYPLHHHYRSLFNKADILLTNSDLESKLISNLFDIPIEKCHKTRNSITNDYQTKNTSINFKHKFNIKNDFILTVANIDERKNTERLVKACEQIGVDLISIGDVRHKERFDMVKNSHRFRSLGAISDPDILKAAYQSCSLFVLPSMCETPGIAALEAASQGSKIVITECGSTKEYFQDYVTYVNPWIIDSIAKGIESELKQKRDESLAHLIKDQYTWEKTAHDIIDGYNKILN